MTRDELERQLPEIGYTYDGDKDRWDKVEESENLTVPILGSGSYKRVRTIKFMTVFVDARLIDRFKTENETIIVREVFPYPIQKRWSSVKIISAGLKSLHRFTECDLNYLEAVSPTNRRTLPVILSFCTPRIYRAIYGSDGRLENLNVNSDSGPFVSFGFADKHIVDSNNKPLGNLEYYLNTGKKLLFDERHYLPNQDDKETKIEVINPAFKKQLLTLTVPTTVAIRDLSKVLLGNNKHWLNIFADVPINF